MVAINFKCKSVMLSSLHRPDLHAWIGMLQRRSNTNTMMANPFYYIPMAAVMKRRGVSSSD